MKYYVAILDTEPEGAKLAASLGDRPLQPRSVYVVGMDEEVEFALALQNVNSAPLVIKDTTSGLMLNLQFSEAIGTESTLENLDMLVGLARVRVSQIQREHDSYLGTIRGHRIHR